MALFYFVVCELICVSNVNEDAVKTAAVHIFLIYEKNSPSSKRLQYFGTSRVNKLLWEHRFQGKENRKILAYKLIFRKNLTRKNASTLTL